MFTESSKKFLDQTLEVLVFRIEIGESPYVKSTTLRKSTRPIFQTRKLTKLHGIQILWHLAYSRILDVLFME